jgi:hypothetical protein
MRDTNDWRLANQAQYLTEVVLVWAKYHPAKETNDHDHCEFCWAKFSLDDSPDTIKEGYATKDRERWICKPCYEDFKDLFKWQVIRPA